MYPEEYICFNTAHIWMQPECRSYEWVDPQCTQGADHQSPQFSLCFPQKRKWILFYEADAICLPLNSSIWVDLNFFSRFLKRNATILFSSRRFFFQSKVCLRSWNFKAYLWIFLNPICIKYQYNMFVSFSKRNKNYLPLKYKDFIAAYSKHNRYIEQSIYWMCNVSNLTNAF